MKINNISLKGTLSAHHDLPGDKSISHRALIFAALAKSPTLIEGLNQGEDVLNTQKALASIGVTWSLQNHILRCQGRPLVWQSPQTSINLGNSGTSARLLTGLMAALPLKITLAGDHSLSRRPMDRIITPLQQMGAVLNASPGQCLPITITGQRLIGGCHHLPIPSAQLKSSLLLAGMLAHGKTTLQGMLNSRDHTERMMSYFNIPLHITSDALIIEGPVSFKGQPISIPADPSAAAFFAVAALIVPNSHIRLHGINWNPYRHQIFHILKQMGGHICIYPQPALCGEPVADIEVKTSTLHGIETASEQAPSLIDEFPILFIAASLAQGRSIFRGLAELRVKESDRLHAMAYNLNQCGLPVEIHGHDLHILGLSDLPNTHLNIKTFQDHRIAMSFAILNLVYPGHLYLDDYHSIKTSFPRFFDCLAKLQQH